MGNPLIIGLVQHVHLYRHIYDENNRFHKVGGFISNWDRPYSNKRKRIKPCLFDWPLPSHDDVVDDVVVVVVVAAAVRPFIFLINSLPKQISTSSQA
jgi:hypothetical protein